MVHSAEGTRAIALELCREFEDKFLLHLTGGEVSIFFRSNAFIICVPVYLKRYCCVHKLQDDKQMRKKLIYL